MRLFVLGLTATLLLTTIPTSQASEVDKQASRKAVAELKTYLKGDSSKLKEVAKQSFSQQALTKEDAAAATKALWASHKNRIAKTLESDWKARKLKWKGKELPFHFIVYGKKPKGGRSLFISLHGGGGAPARVNDQQWNNQKRLYKPKEGVYVAPRAPTNTWNLWHQAHIDPLFDLLIAGMIAFEDVNPNRVYVMGYSAGGDGVYQIGPRMADRWAAAAMMAGHPNDASPISLRNTPFTIHMGGKDSAYNRNKVAAQWGKRLDDLQKGDPKGYVHLTKIYPEFGHWMQRKDAVAVDWMAQYTRPRFPKKVVWVQDDVVGSRFYWLGMKPPYGSRVRIDASVDHQKITLTSPNAKSVELRLSDELIDLDKPIEVLVQGKPFKVSAPKRTISTIHQSLVERADPSTVYYWSTTIPLK